jgi:hypothetical protein
MYIKSISRCILLVSILCMMLSCITVESGYIIEKTIEESHYVKSQNTGKTYFVPTKYFFKLNTGWVFVSYDQWIVFEVNDWFEISF